MLMIAFALLTACDDTSFKSHEVVVDGEGYDAVVDVMNANCVMCHNAAAPGANLALDGDLCDALVDVEGRAGVLVVAGDAANSYLVAKMEGTSDIEGTVMPPGGRMSDENLDIVRDWIDDGAQCNAEADADSIDTGDDGEDDEDTGNVGDDSTLTFSAVYAILTTHGCANCHNSGSTNYSTEGAAHATVLSQITVGNGEASYLPLKINGEAGGGRMPPSAPRVSEAELVTIRAWIDDGAPE